MSEANAEFISGLIRFENPIENQAGTILLTLTITNGVLVGLAAQDNQNQNLDVTLCVEPQSGVDDEGCKCLVNGVWVDCPCPGGG